MAYFVKNKNSSQSSKFWYVNKKKQFLFWNQINQMSFINKSQLYKKSEKMLKLSSISDLVDDDNALEKYWT